MFHHNKKKSRQIPFQEEQTSVKGLNFVYAKVSLQQSSLSLAFSIKGSGNGTYHWS